MKCTELSYMSLSSYLSITGYLCFFINNGIQKNKDQHQGRCYLCIPWSNLNDDSAYLENCTIKISFVTQVLICSVAQSKKGGIRKKHTPKTLKPICYFIQCCLTYVCVGEYKSFRKYKKHPTFNIWQRNPNSNADELLLRVTEMMKNQFGMKPKE